MNPHTQISVIWSVEDVQILNSGLTDEQALNVLHSVKKNHDASIGICWDTLEYWIEELYPDVDPLEKVA